MTHSDDFIGLLEDYLDSFDGATPLPDRVRDAIRAELPSARQVRPRPGLERVLSMLSNASAGAKLGLGAATIVIAALVGGAYLNNSAGVVGTEPTWTPAVTPTATAAATAAPSQAALPPSLTETQSIACAPADRGRSCILPGHYQLGGARRDWPAAVTLDVPLGFFEWSGGSGWEALLAADPPAFDGSGWGVMFTSVSDVYRDPCDVSKGTIPAAQVTTPEQLAAAIAAWPGFTATTPTVITVDGHHALQLTLSGSKATRCGSGNTWVTKAGYSVDAYPMANPYGGAYPTVFRIVDTGQGLLVIRSAAFTDTSPAELGGGVAQSATRHAADVAGLQSVVDSVRLTDWPASN
jgi:hypothetical protein